MITAIILSALFGLVVFIFFGWLGNKVVGKWHTSTRSP
jgi:NitT/TauT family transport system permease protein